MGSALAVFAHAQTKFLWWRSSHRSADDKWRQRRRTFSSTREGAPSLRLPHPLLPRCPPPTVLGGSGRSKSGTVRPTVDTDGSVDRPDASHVGEGIPVQRSGGAPTSREASRPPSLPEATDTTDRDDTRTGGKWHKKRRRGGKGGRKKGPPNRR